MIRAIRSATASHMASPTVSSPMARRRPPMGGGGGSFLGTAAAAAAGMVGGSLLLSSIRSMMGGSQPRPSATPADARRRAANRSPWSDQSSSDLARDAGINDIGSSRGSRRRQFARGIVRYRVETTTHRIDDDHDDMDLDFGRFRRRRRQRLRLIDSPIDFARNAKRPLRSSGRFDFKPRRRLR